MHKELLEIDSEADLSETSLKMIYMNGYCSKQHVA